MRTRSASTSRANVLVVALDWGVELRLWVATCVTCLSAFCGLVERSLGFNVSLHAALPVVFAATLALYNLDGTLDAPRSEPRRRRAHLGLTLFSCGLLVGTLPQMSAAGIAVIAAGFLLCSFYALPRTFRDGGIKTLPGIKAPFVGFAVAFAAALVPLLSIGGEGVMSQGSQTLGPLAALVVSVGLLCTVNATLFDVPDFAEDASNRVPTFVVVRGLARTRMRALWLSASAATLVALWGPATAARPLVALSASLIAAAFWVKKETSRSHVAWFVDGTLLFPLALILL